MAAFTFKPIYMLNIFWVHMFIVVDIFVHYCSFCFVYEKHCFPDVVNHFWLLQPFQSSSTKIPLLWKEKCDINVLDRVEYSSFIFSACQSKASVLIDVYWKGKVLCWQMRDDTLIYGYNNKLLGIIFMSHTSLQTRAYLDIGFWLL